MKPRPPRNKIHTHTHTYARSHSRVVITEARLIIGRRCWEIMKADPTPATPLGVFFTGHLYLLQSLCLKGKSVRNKLMGGEKKKKKNKVLQGSSLLRLLYLPSTLARVYRSPEILSGVKYFRRTNAKVLQQRI